jgi:hypothetical protein
MSGRSTVLDFTTLVLLPWVSFAEGFAWRLVCKATNAAFLAVPESRRPIQHQSADKWMEHRWTRAGFPWARQAIQALRDHTHVEAGSDVLDALLSPAAWAPGDADFFGLCSESTGPRTPTHEFAHYTPFMHDAFAFPFRFYTDAEMQALGTEAPYDGRLQERLECVRRREGYELVPAWIRGYRLLTTKYIEHQDSLADVFHRPKRGIDVSQQDAYDGIASMFGDSDTKTITDLSSTSPVASSLWPGDTCSLVFDYILIRRALGPEVETLLHQSYRFPPAIARLVAEYGGRDGHSSIPSFFDANCELPFTAVVFDGWRFRVRDWDSVWTQSATVRGPVMDHSDNLETKTRKWHRLLDRIGKYRSRNFSVELDCHGMTEALLCPAGTQPTVVQRSHRRRGGFRGRRGRGRGGFYGGRGGRSATRSATRSFRRESTPHRPGIRTTQSPWFYHTGLIEPDRLWNDEEWRPTHRLRHERQRLKLEEVKEAPTFMNDAWQPLPDSLVHGGSAPSTPRSTHSHRELHHDRFVELREESRPFARNSGEWPRGWDDQ